MKDGTKVVWLASVLVFAVACGGGGGDSQRGNNNSGSSNIQAGFTPDNGSPAGGDVALASVGTTGDTVALQVRVTGTNDLFGASFDVMYDPTQVQFVSHSAGSAIESGGQVSYLVNSAQAGRVSVGISCLTCSSGVAVSGTEPLVELVFRATSTGNSSLSFANESLIDSQSPPSSIPGLNWFGGTVVAN